MINVNNSNTMHRHEPIIQLSDHVKNKLKQHKYPKKTSPFINSSDEFVEVNSTYEDDDDDDDDDNENDLESLYITAPEDLIRPRRDTYTTYEVKPRSGLFFTDRKSDENHNKSFLKETYKKQNECEECLQRDRIIYLQQQDLRRLYQQNKQLNKQLHSSILLNHQYENHIKTYKLHLTKVNTNLSEYQINYDDLKQKILSDQKTKTKIDEEQEEVDDDDNEPVDHIKRLRYEIQMYNRIVAAKEKQEKNQEKQIDFLF